MPSINMAEYGLLGKFEAFANEHKEQFSTARIISQERGLYRLITEDGEQHSEISGKLRYNAEAASGYPAVGDFVLIDKGSASSNASSRSSVVSIARILLLDSWAKNMPDPPS